MSRTYMYGVGNSVILTDGREGIIIRIRKRGGDYGVIITKGENSYEGGSNLTCDYFGQSEIAKEKEDATKSKLISERNALLKEVGLYMVPIAFHIYLFAKKTIERNSS